MYTLEGNLTMKQKKGVYHGVETKLKGHINYTLGLTLTREL